jgi:hypothetical protein
MHRHKPSSLKSKPCPKSGFSLEVGAVALSSKPFSRRLPIDMHPDKKRTRPLFSDRKEQENALVLFVFCNLRIFLSLGDE